jgi:hypothetical protein
MKMRIRAFFLMCLMAAAAYTGLAAFRSIRNPWDGALPAEVYRARRRETRAMEQSLLTTLASGELTDVETRTMAEKQLVEITANDETELAVEGALAAHGYADALCVARNGSMTVFLPGEITADEAAFFLEIARDASGLEPESIRLTGY